MDPTSDVELGNRVIHFAGMGGEGCFGLFPLWPGRSRLPALHMAIDDIACPQADHHDATVRFSVKSIVSSRLTGSKETFGMQVGREGDERHHES